MLKITNINWSISQQKDGSIHHLNLFVYTVCVAGDCWSLFPLHIQCRVKAGNTLWAGWVDTHTHKKGNFRLQST